MSVLYQIPDKWSHITSVLYQMQKPLQEKCHLYLHSASLLIRYFKDMTKFKFIQYTTKKNSTFFSYKDISWTFIKKTLKKKKKNPF